MATQKLLITKNHSEESDGKVWNREKDIIGAAWNKQGPNDKYIEIKLDGYWLLSDEEINKLKNK